MLLKACKDIGLAVNRQNRNKKKEKSKGMEIGCHGERFCRPCHKR